MLSMLPTENQPWLHNHASPPHLQPTLNPQYHSKNTRQVAREIFIHSQLDHPHVIGLFAAFEDAEKVYLLQEYAEGVSHAVHLHCIYVVGAGVGAGGCEGRSGWGSWRGGAQEEEQQIKSDQTTVPAIYRM